MLGLFGTLNLGAKSLQTQQLGIEVAGHNLANVNNPAYARQRLGIATSVSIPTAVGIQGTGAEGVAIVRLRSDLVDGQVAGEASARGFLEAQQLALQYAQANLGQEIDRRASGTDGTSTAGGVGGQHGIADGLTGLFNAFQGLSTNPTSLTERQVLMQKAAELASRFNQVDARLAELRSALDDSLQADVTGANALLAGIAGLNDQIATAEINSPGLANDLRDLRQAKIESLAKLVNISTSAGANGAVDISIGGVAMVTGKSVDDVLETALGTGGELLVQARGAGSVLALAGGSMAGTIDARDGAIATLQGEVNTLAATLIAQVNAVHAAGFSLTGSTGAAFFTGTGAADIAVNAALLGDAALVQAAGVAGAVGDNTVALALAQLGNARLAGLNNQTFSENFSRTVAGLGQALASANNALEDQALVDEMLRRQRESLSGVSLDEEMTDLVKFQKAFAASAKLITTVDEMLEAVIGMKR
jgi:flagellar hook-associated protein 1 FlgK